MKTMKLIIILTAVALISGCTINKDKEYGPVNNDGYSLIEANLQNLLFGEGERTWPKGASIGVYGSEQGENEAYSIKKAGAGLKTAEFYGPLVKGDVAAYYPYNQSYVADLNAMPASLSAEQVYNVDPVKQFLDYTPMAYARMQDGKLKFYYPNGLIRIKVNTQLPIKVLNIKLSSETAHLSGNGVIDAEGTFHMTENSYKYVTLDCMPGITSQVNDQLTDYYLVVVPGTYDNMKLSLYIDGYVDPFECNLQNITVESFSAYDYTMTAVEFTPSDLDGFTEKDEQFDK